MREKYCSIARVWYFNTVSILLLQYLAGIHAADVVSLDVALQCGSNGYDDTCRRTSHGTDGREETKTIA